MQSPYASFIREPSDLEKQMYNYGYSAANIVLIAQRAAKIGVLAGCKKVCNEHFVKALEESSKF